MAVLKKIAVLVISFGALSFFSAQGNNALAAEGIQVQYHTQEEIKDFIEKSGATVTEPIVYEEEPSTKGEYAPGRLSQETRDSALAMLNQIRYIAGIDADVAWDEEYEKMAQAGALVNCVNNEMSHFPKKPEGMTQALYELGYAGTSSSNIGQGYSNLNEALVGGWMQDGDDGNISVVGHRRWCLNPAMAKTAFGAVGAQSAMYAFDSQRQSDYYGVAWPAQNMPVEYFGSDYPWTISMGTKLNRSGITVTLTRESDQKTWAFSDAGADGYFNIDNESYGAEGCIIFRPSDIHYNAGDVFHVSVEGLPSPVSYDVEFFNIIEPKINVQYHTQEEIKDFIEKSGATVTEPIVYEEEPSTKGEYAPGRLSQETRDSALAMLNQIRYIAGIDADVAWDEEYEKMAQAGALLSCINDEMSFAPVKPDGMSQELYEFGYAGMSASVVGKNYSGLNQGLLKSWMRNENIRRWCLNPVMAKTAFGAVGAYFTMYAFDSQRQSDYYGVAWPAQNMPVEYFGDEDPWTIFMGTEVDQSGIMVILTRESDQKTWTFSDAGADNGCIIFRPSNIHYNAGDVFHVSVEGLSSPVSYNVNFFNIETSEDPSFSDDGDENEAENKENTEEQDNTENKESAEEQDNTDNTAQIKKEAKLNQQKATVKVGKSVKLKVKNTTEKVRWSSNHPKIAKVDKNGKVTGKKAGKAVIKAKVKNGKTLTCTVTVKKAKNKKKIKK